MTVSDLRFWLYLAVMAGVTYLVRMLPLVLVRGRIKNRFMLSFLHYLPAAVLSVMTIPAIFYATGSTLSAVVGFAVALLLGWREKSLVTVAALASAAVLIAELVIGIM